MSSWAVQSLEGVLTELQGLADGGSRDTLNFLVLSLELPLREFVVKCTISTLEENEDAAASHITTAIQNLKEIQEYTHTFESHTPPLMYTGLSGRPRFKEQLRFLLESHFTVPQIAKMIGVLTRTIE